jgi:serine/threonine-protein phosphatase 2A regulatory subunit B''
MIRPADPYHITLEDIVKSGTGDVMVGILTDMNCFWLYENRESLVASEEQ